MLDVLRSSFPLRATLATLLAFLAVACLFGGVYWLLRLGTARGRKVGARPAPLQGPQESLDVQRERDAW